jgi:hypothetical protein
MMSVDGHRAGSDRDDSRCEAPCHCLPITIEDEEYPTSVVVDELIDLQQ